MTIGDGIAIFGVIWSFCWVVVRNGDAVVRNNQIQLDAARAGFKLTAKDD